ncbi:unnamed protein product [Mucor fragilis]
MRGRPRNSSSSCTNAACAESQAEINALKEKVASVEARLAALEALLVRNSANNAGLQVGGRKRKVPRDPPLSRSLRDLAKEHNSNDNSGESLEDKIRKACIVYEQSALGPSPSAVALANAASIASLRATDFLANEKKKLKATSRAAEEKEAETLKSKLYSRKSRKLQARKAILATNASKYSNQFDVSFNALCTLFCLEMMSDEEDAPEASVSNDSRIRLIPSYRSKEMTELLNLADVDYAGSSAATGNRRSRIVDTRTLDLPPPQGFKEKFDKWGFADNVVDVE